MDVELQEREEPRGTPFYPSHFIKQMIVVYLVIGAVISLAVLWPVGLQEKAEPLVTPSGILLPWYLGAVYGLAKAVSARVAVTTVAVGYLVLMVWPLLDRGARRQPRRRLKGMVLLIVVVGATLYLAVLGEHADKPAAGARPSAEGGRS